MTPDDLDTRSLTTLDEVFAVEVAGWKIANPEEMRERYRHWIPPGKPVLKNAIYTERPGKFSTSSDAVLPWLDKVGAEIHHSHHSQKIGWLWQVSVYYDGSYFPVESEAPTFPHAAVLALIRAERAKKQPNA